MFDVRVRRMGGKVLIEVSDGGRRWTTFKQRVSTKDFEVVVAQNDVATFFSQRDSGAVKEEDKVTFRAADVAPPPAVDIEEDAASPFDAEDD